MRRSSCPYCEKLTISSYPCTKTIRFGFFYRTSDKRYIQRYRCMDCKKCYSSATFHPCFGQRKRQYNGVIGNDLSSGKSLRRISFNLGINIKTTVRKLVFLGSQAQVEFRLANENQAKARSVEFDDMETFEHTKCKPLSITLAVESKTRRILGFEVSTMPARGPLAEKSVRLYGRRRDRRRIARRRLLKSIKPLMEPDSILKSDSNPHYAADVREILSACRYRQFKGKRGSSGGQGELKKVKFDPLYSLNHTCAKFRADVNRLIRKTWCTTKRQDRLSLHLAIYADFHNKNFASL